MLIYKTIVKMQDTDAAGILFFGSQFKMMHEAYEKFLESIDFSFAKLIRKTSFFLPIVHAEADYKWPLFVGDRITISLRIGRIGQTSFTISYTLLNNKKKIVGLGKTVHVSVNAKNHKKIPLPSPLRRALLKAAPASSLGIELN